MSDRPRPSSPTQPTPGTVTMYSTTWCGYCRRLKGQMDREGIGYTEVNIEHDPDAAEFVDDGQRRQPDRADRALPRRLRRHQPVARRRSKRRASA